MGLRKEDEEAEFAACCDKHEETGTTDTPAKKFTADEKQCSARREKPGKLHIVQWSLFTEALGHAGCHLSQQLDNPSPKTRHTFVSKVEMRNPGKIWGLTLTQPERWLRSNN